MLNHPRHELSILSAHVRKLFPHGHVGLEIGCKKLPGDIPEPFFSDAWHCGIAGVADGQFYVLLGLGVAGLPVFIRRNGATALVIPLTLVYFTALHTLLFPDDPRFHLPMLPFLAISAAGLVVGASERSPALLSRSRGWVSTLRHPEESQFWVNGSGLPNRQSLGLR